MVIAPAAAPDLDALVRDAAHEIVAAPTEPAPAPVEPFLPAAADTAPVADTIAPASLPDPVAEPDPVEQAVSTAETVQQGTNEMATTYEATAGADKIQSMFGDVNTRAKSAMEKSTKLVEEMTSLAKGNVEAIVESSKLAAKGAETMGQDAAEYGRKSFESATVAFKGFASVKSPSELFQLQSDYAKSSLESAVAEASKFSETYMKLMGDVFAPITGRIQLATDKIKSAAL
jgi:phasin family protein